MNMRRKMNTITKTPTFYCSFCCRHILITFVGMTLLIVNYGVNTAHMPADPPRNGNCIKSGNSSNSSSSSSSRCVNSGEVLSLMINGLKYENEELLWTRNKTASNLKNIPRPETPTASEKEKFLKGLNQTELGLVGVKFRNPRFFGLFGSNFSLSYNLTLSSGNSAGNITVISPAPAPTYYYYQPAPSYSYYPYYNYYNPNAYNPYGSTPQYYYDPNSGQIYYV